MRHSSTHMAPLRQPRGNGSTSAEPYALGPLHPVVRRWPIVVVTTAVLLAAALAVGFAQRPTYTAAADVNVGRVDVRVQTLPGYVAGAQALAGAYSPVVYSDAVVLPLARRLGISPAAVRARVGAAPIPDATMFRIYGHGDSAADAV